MVYDIILGRSADDRKKYGTRGAILLAKQFIKMGQTTSLSNKVYMDVTGAHIVFVCGKRGGGKSYTMGVIAEGMATIDPDIRDNISVIILDTMGVYWSMKYPNHRDEELLNMWGLKGKGLDVKIFTPAGYFDQYKKQGIATDIPFSIRPSELNPEDWFLSFEISPNDPMGVLIERLILELKKEGKEYSIGDIIEAVRTDERSEKVVKDAVENRFLGAENWGVFSAEGTPLKDLAKGGQVTVLDVSCYATMPGGWKIKSLVVGIVASKMFIERMTARKAEELESIKSAVHYLTEKAPSKKKSPVVWMIIDEAHEFLPLEGKTASSGALITILREGRQPGVSLILATQQPGKIHTDVMTQSDILISHRITAKLDVDALGRLMQSYLREGLDKQLNNLPRVKGAGLIVDDTNERMYPVRIRPRFTWHGGISASAMPEEKQIFE